MDFLGKVRLGSVPALRLVENLGEKAVQASCPDGGTAYITGFPFPD